MPRLTVSEFKAQAASWFARLAATGQPVVITQNGKPAGVLLSPGAFDSLTERARFVVAIEDGLEDSKAGRTASHMAVIARFSPKIPASKRRPR